MTLAVKVERLGRDDQLAIAEQIGTEGSAKAVVRQYLEALRDADHTPLASKRGTLRSAQVQ